MDEGQSMTQAPMPARGVRSGSLVGGLQDKSPASHEQALIALDQELTICEEAISDLTNKLSPILQHPMDDPSTKPEQDQMPFPSKVAQDIEARVRRARNIRFTLRDLIKLIDL